MVAARERGRERERERERDGVVQRETRTLPPRPVVLRPIFALSLSRRKSLSLFRLLPSPPCIFRSLPRIVSTMIHWIPLTFFTTATPKGMHTYAVHTVIHGTRYTGSSGVFRTFEFFPRVKSSIFSLFLPLARLPTRRSTFTFCTGVSALTPKGI